MNKIELPHSHDNIFEQNLDLIPSKEVCTKVAQQFNLLSDGTRLRLYWILLHGEECIINLSAIMNMSSPSIAHHLKSLRLSGLVVSRREGKEVYYKAVENKELSEFLDHLINEAK